MVETGPIFRNLHKFKIVVNSHNLPGATQKKYGEQY